MTNLAIENVRLRDLRLFSGNARRGDVDKIAQSLEVNGQYKPIVVNRGTLTDTPNEVLAGNHTVMAAQKLGWTHIDAVFVDVDRQAAVRIVLVDNQASDIASNDDAALLELLGELDDLDGSAFEQSDLDALLAAAEDDDVPDFEPDDEQGTLDLTQPKECPSCHYQWKVGPNGEIVSV
ncbi:ParB-like nuclease domain protein [Microbacterium phage Blett]|nr:ParB-like nuclease domain protein [Microbacterium phage Blett]